MNPVVRRSLRCLLPLWFCWPAASQQPVAEPSGWFVGPALELVLEQQGDHFLGELSIDGRWTTLEARQQGTGLAGDFEWFGQRHAFSAQYTATGIELSSGGAQLALTRRSTSENPLVALAAGAAARGAEARATNLAGPPTRLTLITGASVELPSGWQVAWQGDAPLLLPPRAAGAAGELSLSLAELTWTGGRDLTSGENLGTLARLAGQMVPGSQQRGKHRRLAPGVKDRIALGFSLPGRAPQDGSLTLSARALDTSLVLVVALGPEAELRSLEPQLTQLLASAQPGQPLNTGGGYPTAGGNLPPGGLQQPGAPGFAGPGAQAPSTPAGPLDQALLGRWRSVEALGDARFEGSMVVETVYDFHPDGRFVLGSAAAGGGFGLTYDGDFRVFSTGTWSTSNGLLYTLSDTGEQGQVPYLFNNGQLVFKLQNGKYAFWVR
jgi:hypothetical protein